MKYISSKNGYVSMVKNRVGGSVNLMSHQPENESNSLPQAEPPSHTNSIVGVIRPPAPLVKGGSLVESLAKINFSKNSKDNKRKNIVLAVRNIL